MQLTTPAEQQLWGQAVGTGVLFLKVAHDAITAVEVFLRHDGVLCRVQDGQPVSPVHLIIRQEGAE